ncbi:ABC transporter substrate-binding protein [Symbiobacterium thermophilum]|uniref:ABC transporter substrate-binding protein n=1 Tax=Symbiobacterium thermophilum TaxID=2734 RepID=UPI0035C6D816
MRISRRAATLMSLLVVTGLALSACGPKQTQNPSGTGGAQTEQPSPSSGQPAVGGNLNLLLEKEPDSFNPILYTTAYGAEIVTQLYATLFEFNEKYEPMPYVAESWEISDDNLTLSIKIREGIKFTDGTDLDAEDVAFTLGAIMDPEYTGARASSLRDVESIEVVDKYNLNIHLKKPSAPLLTNINYGILSKEAFEGYSIADMEKAPASMDKPVGAGPYKLKEYVRGQYVVLERNPDWFMSEHYGGAPFIETLTYKIIPDSQTALAALQNGEIDRLTPEASDVAMLETQFKDKLTAYYWDRNGFGYMTLNNSKAPLDDKRVRQALTLGLDRQAIITGVLENRATIPPGPIPPISWAFDESIQVQQRDVAKAKQLLEEAGFVMNESTGIYERDGQPLKLTFYAGAGATTTEAIGAIARSSWKEIGVDLDVQMIDFSAMMDNYVAPGKFDVTFSAFSLGLDPDSMYNLFHSSAGRPDANGNVNGFNRARFYNDRVDELLEKAREEFEPAKRKEYYSEFQRIIVDEAPVIMIYSNIYTDFVNSRVKGVVNMPGYGATSDYIYRWYINEK